MQKILGGFFVLSMLILRFDVAQAATVGHMLKSSTPAADTDITGSVKKPGAKAGDNVIGSGKKPGTLDKKPGKPSTVPAQ